MSRGVLVLAVVLIALPVPIRAQEGAPGDGLRAAAERVASGWRSGGVGDLGPLLRDRGIRFHAEGGGRETLDPRKAMAALEDLLARRHTSSARVVRVTLAEGSRDRGSTEIAWDAVAPGTSEVLRYTLFIGFLREEGRWRIYEIRVLP